MAVMTKKETTNTEMNLTIVALVAVVAIVGLVALVMNAAPTQQAFGAEELLASNSHATSFGSYEIVEQQGDELTLRKKSEQTTYSDEENTAGMKTKRFSAGPVKR